MRTVLRQWENDGDRFMVVMVFRKKIDPIFYLYYNYVDETEVQRTVYKIDKLDVHYYEGGNWH